MPEFKKFLRLVIFLSTNQKNKAVLEQRTGYFRGLVGFKAKDFKMCLRERPRGQERTRGLHLCY